MNVNAIFSHRYFQAWMTAAAAASFVLFVIAAEREFDALAFTFGCWGLIASITFALSGRPKFSLVISSGLLALSAAFSMVKFKLLAMNVHVFDVWFYLIKSDTLSFLLESFGILVFAGALAFVALTVAGFFALRRESRVVRSPVMLTGLALGYALSIPLNEPANAVRFDYHIHKSHFISSFFISLRDVPRIAEPSPVANIVASQRGALPFAAPAACRPETMPPDIVLVLSESAVPPAQVPGWKYDPSITPYFTSFDGKTHRMRAETHGGGTWISATSVMSGMSMADFGWMRPYATMLLKGRLQDGLPKALAECGYKTVMISPQKYNFVSEGPLMRSLGIEDYLDLDVLAAPTKHEADEFYFRKAREYIDRHRRDDGRPLFVFIETMAAHAPYHFKFKPERVARGEPFGNDAEADEYLRRLTFAQEDYAAFAAALKTGASARPVLMAQFGDHHPAITTRVFDAAGQGNDWRSGRFETFYAFTPIHFTVTKPMPAVEVLDMAYLGATLMQMAGLPLTPSMAEKIELRDVCAGAFHTCPRREAVDRHIARLAASGLLVEPGAQAAVAR